jgi:putative transposase
MARPPRCLTVFAGYCVHKVWRGHNKEDNLGTPIEKSAYLGFLNEDLESERYQAGCELNALTLMDNHTHEFCKVLDPGLFSAHMRRVHSRFGAFFNRLKSRCGKVAQDRPHTTLLEAEQAEIEAVLYVHANPVRANMVKDARHYRWSTHKLYAFGQREDWMRNVVLPQWYLNLGNTALVRQRNYRRLFANYLREKGRFKQTFLRRRFYGNPAWMLQQEKKVADWRKQRRHPPPPQ